MTYLEMVNEVLKRLREREVSTYTATTYSKMVGAFVNDAKDQIEKAWDWGANRQIISVSAVDGTREYSLSGFGEDGKVITAYNDSQNGPLQERSQAYFDRVNYTGNLAEGPPIYYCFRGLDASNDSKIEIHPTPNASYTLRFNCCVPQAELAADGTSLNIPWRPVVLLAVAMLAEEKGETDGQTSRRYFEMSDKALSDAIAFDAAKHPLEPIWYEV